MTAVDRAKRYALSKRMSVVSLLAFGFYLALSLSPSAADPTSFNSGNSRVQIVDGLPRRITIHTVAPSQENIRILGHTRPDAKCRQAQETDFVLVKPPLHGTVCFRVESSPLKFTLKAGETSCIGAYVLGSVVYYRPTRGYTGPDAFQYALVDAGDNPYAIADVDVAATPPLISSSEIESEKSAETLPENGQIPGPMERCPDPPT